jgi:hypothetical protein
MRKGSNVFEVPDGALLGVRHEKGWVGAFTRSQAREALFANGQRIKKIKGKPGDAHKEGTEGTVLGSVYHPAIGVAYFVEWDRTRRHPNEKRYAVLVVGWRVMRA